MGGRFATHSDRCELPQWLTVPHVEATTDTAFPEGAQPALSRCQVPRSQTADPGGDSIASRAVIDSSREAPNTRVQPTPTPLIPPEVFAAQSQYQRAPVELPKTPRF